MNASRIGVRPHGSIVDTPVPELFSQLVRQRFDGTLTVARGKERKRIIWHRGAPVLVDTNTLSERLVTRLQDEGRITATDAARVANQQRQRGGREESTLLALGILDADEVLTWLRRLLRERLLALFAWSQGDYAIDAEARAGESAAAMRTDPLPLLQEGLAVHRPAARMREGLSDRAQRFVDQNAQTASLVQRLHGDPEIDAFVSAMDGSRRLADLMEPLRSPVALAGLWVLDAMGALRLRTNPALRNPTTLRREQIEILSPGASEQTASNADRTGSRATASARSAPAGANADAEEVRAEILSIHASLDERTHYEMLGVESDASPAQVKRAYLQAAKRFHPDALARSGLLDVREEARAVFSHIARAHSVLGDSRRRRDYDANLAGDGENMDAAAIVQAEMLYRKADILLRAGNFTGALEFLSPASELVPTDAAYAQALGWAHFKKVPPDLDAARDALERAVKLDDSVAVAHHRLGLVLRALGETDAAQRAFERAFVLDPSLGRG